MKIYLLLCFFLLTACHTIRFIEGDKYLHEYKDLTKNPLIHHVGALGLMEFSYPIAPKEICRDKQAVSYETKYSLLTWIISRLWIYSPVAATVYCSGDDITAKDPKLEKKRSIASLEQTSGEDITFKVLKIRNKKALVIFKKEIPESEFFELDNKEVNILKSKKNKAVISVKNIGLEVGKLYKASF